MIERRTGSHRGPYGRLPNPIVAIITILLVSGSVLVTDGVAGAQENGGFDDAEITLGIIARLSSDESLSAHLIDVETNEGIVELSGTVDHLLARDRAVEIARTTRGVRSVIDRLDVAPIERPDDEIYNDIIAAERTRARNDAWVRGVRSVDVRDLVVDPEKVSRLRRSHPAVDIPDGEIERAIRDAFFYDPRISSFNPGIRVEAGAVTLTGSVKSLGAKRAAAETARNTVGVWKVNNFLSVRPEKVPEDDELRTIVKNALDRDPYVERHDIAVMVRNGRVYLYGTVDSYFERNHAEEVVSKLRGVVEVANRLKFLSPETRQNDDEILGNIRSELMWSPFVDDDGVEALVEDGVATLTGTVSSVLEKRKADENAREGGAVRVRNRLEVGNGSKNGKSAE